MFEDKIPFILLKLPLCKQNEIKSKDATKKFNKFTNDSFSLLLVGNTVTYSYVIDNLNGNVVEGTLYVQELRKN